MNAVIADQVRQPTLIAVSEQTPPIATPVDAEVDIEILKAIPKQFAIVDENSANWLVRKIMAARQYIINVKAWADLEQKRAQREEMTLMFLFGRQIENWTKDQIDKLDGRRKSISLPAGTVGFRSEKRKLVIDDDDTVLGWVRKNLPAAIKTEETLMKSVLNEHFDKTGEVPDVGAHVEPASEKFSIR
jgi:phage host-nuclease inhibitor protein Gam